MLAKPLTILCVFLLAIVNFIILLSLLSLLVFPIFIFFRDIFFEFGPNLFFFLVSRISGAIIIFITLDTVFGLTLRRLRKGTIPFKKATYVFGHADLTKSFEWLKDKFGISNVKLYIDPDVTVMNAYAIGSFSGSGIIVTQGLINHMQNSTGSYEEFLDSVRAILGHEMAHLTNKDFFPGLLISASETVTHKTSRIIRWIFIIVSRIVRIIPFFGRPISMLIIRCYNVLHRLLMAFSRFIFMPIYRFLQKMFSRSIEYRCDRESAYAYGGQKVAKALGMLGKSGYFSLFSTHPKTKDRVRAVRDIVPKTGVIRPGIMNTLSTLLSVALIVCVYSFSAKKADIPDMYERYIEQIHIPAHKQIKRYKEDYDKFMQRWK